MSALWTADAMREAMRAQAEGKGEASARRELEHALLVGSDVVFLRGEYLQVGQVAFKISEVREYALRGANLPLTGGRLLQAAMGLLVVAAEERAAAGEDLQLLSKRVADYEAWIDRTTLDLTDREFDFVELSIAVRDDAERGEN